MRAVVFSGTTEGRAFSKQLGALGADVLVSVATDLGAEEQGSAPVSPSGPDGWNRRR